MEMYAFCHLIQKFWLNMTDAVSGHNYFLAAILVSVISTIDT